MTTAIRVYGLVKVNQKMALFGFVKNKFGRTQLLKSWVWKPSFFLLIIKNQSLINKFKLQVSLLRHVQNQRIRSAIVENKTKNWKHCYSGVSKFRSKTDIEKPENWKAEFLVYFNRIWILQIAVLGLDLTLQLTISQSFLEFWVIYSNIR